MDGWMDGVVCDVSDTGGGVAIYAGQVRGSLARHSWLELDGRGKNVTSVKGLLRNPAYTVWVVRMLPMRAQWRVRCSGMY